MSAAPLAVVDGLLMSAPDSSNPWTAPPPTTRAVSWLSLARTGAAYSVAPKTQKRYQSRVELFNSFCAQYGYVSLPAPVQAVLAYCGFAMQSGQARQLPAVLAAVAHHHKSHGFWSPTQHPAVSQARKGILRWVATHYPRVALWRQPLRPEHLRQCFRVSDVSDPWTVQALTVLSFGLRIGQRAATLGHLHFKDVQFAKEHVAVYISRSKTDQEGRGRYIYLEYPTLGSPEFHPVLLLLRHIRVNGIRSGFLFRAFRKRSTMTAQPLSGRGVNLIVKWCCYDVLRLSGVYSGHSIRIGAATAMSEAGVEDHVIRQTCGWKGPYANVYLRFARTTRGDLTRAIGLA